MKASDFEKGLEKTFNERVRNSNTTMEDMHVVLSGYFRDASRWSADASYELKQSIIPDQAIKARDKAIEWNEKFIQEQITIALQHRDEELRAQIKKMEIAHGNYNCGEEGCCNPNPKDEREKEDFQWQIGYNVAISDILALLGEKK